MGRTQLKEELQVSAKVNFRDDGYTPSPLVIASAIGCRTHTMRIGTNLMLLPFYHPVRVAKDVATLSLQRFRVRSGEPGMVKRLVCLLRQRLRSCAKAWSMGQCIWLDDWRKPVFQSL